MPRANPQRTCAGCRATRPKAEMLRIAKAADGSISMDLTGRLEGRGVYICRRTECLETAIRRKALDRGLKATVPATVIESARETVLACH